MDSRLSSKKSPLSFLQAFLEVFNIFGFNEKRPEFLRRTDAEALAQDWRAVGGDLRRAMRDTK
ncbi:hypothetical protein QWY85_12995 [Neolewinella lacunae]|uniref:Uncharacterized protein n=1 Tax=Neolewinella lacunae TaxID=1517758 RepID=A0A923T8E8_9BACT|nr:hypothetical protein [Neolewinella lacunae]MBC6995545.1 hypothetical protein [Neolewinella lacunae]MDN3635581.1 hypothetical protein [Neolewinella lacunae]